MLHKMSAKFIILYLLQNNKKVNLELLLKVKNVLFQYDPFLHIDFSNKNILALLRRYKDILEIKNEYFVLLKDVSTILDGYNIKLSNKLKDILK